MPGTLGFQNEPDTRGHRDHPAADRDPSRSREPELSSVRGPISCCRAQIRDDLELAVRNGSLSWYLDGHQVIVGCPSWDTPIEAIGWEQTTPSFSNDELPLVIHDGDDGRMLGDNPGIGERKPRAMKNQRRETAPCTDRTGSDVPDARVAAPADRADHRRECPMRNAVGIGGAAPLAGVGGLGRSRHSGRDQGRSGAEHPEHITPGRSYSAQEKTRSRAALGCSRRVGATKRVNGLEPSTFSLEG